MSNLKRTKLNANLHRSMFYRVVDKFDNPFATGNSVPLVTGGTNKAVCLLEAAKGREARFFHDDADLSTDEGRKTFYTFIRVLDNRRR